MLKTKATKSKGIAKSKKELRKRGVPVASAGSTARYIYAVGDVNSEDLVGLGSESAEFSCFSTEG